MSPTEAMQAALREIEATKGVKVLFACESGSRAWGFESVDSDFDARFIYVHPLDWYLDISDHRDVIEQMLPGDLDVSGWELRKALRLMAKSNPPFFEWLKSPIVYREQTNWTAKLRVLASSTYSPERCLHHYRSMAKGNYSAYLTRPSFPLKKYLYVLRPLLACLWIERRLEEVPMEFQTMVEELDLHQTIKTEIGDLILQKRSGSEMGEGPPNPVLHGFIDAEMARIAALSVKSAPKPDMDRINQFFRDTIYSFEKL